MRRATAPRRIVLRALSCLLPCLIAAGLAGGLPGVALAQGLAPRLAQGGRPAPAAPAAQREIVVTNRAAQVVREIYASPSSTDDWGDDRLGSATLAPGRTFRLRLGRTRECSWDLQVVYADGSSEENRDVNVCRLRQVSFDGSGAVAAERGPAQRLEVQNATTARIDQVFVSPADSDRWNEDRLPGLLEPGETSTVEFRGECNVDVRIIYANRSAEERRGIDACASRKLVIAPGWTISADPSTMPVGTAATRLERIGVRNESGRTVVELYLDPDNAERSEDRLGMSVLNPGQERGIPVSLDRACDYTLRAVLSGAGPDLERKGVDLCRERNLAITADGLRLGGAAPTAPAPASPGSPSPSSSPLPASPAPADAAPAPPAPAPPDVAPPAR